jgi:hypothetical protein
MLETLPSRNAFHIGCPFLGFENRGFPNWFRQLSRFTCLGPHGSFFVSGTIYLTLSIEYLVSSSWIYV